MDVLAPASVGVMSSTLGAEEHSALPLMAAVVVGVLILLELVRLQVAYRSIPLAPTAPWTNLKRLRSDASPEFLLALSRQMKASCFRLALPWPLVVVTDPAIARLILQQPCNPAGAGWGALAFWPFFGAAEPYPRRFHGAAAGACALSSKQARARVARAFGMDRIARVRECATAHFARQYAPAADGSSSRDGLALAVPHALGVLCEAALEYVLSEAETDRFMVNMHAIDAAHTPRAPWHLRARARAARAACAARADNQSLAARILEAYRTRPAVRAAHAFAEPSLIGALVDGPGFANDAERLGEVLALLEAAAGQTAAALAWAVYDLASHPAEAAQIRRELAGVRASGTEPLAKSLALADALKESTRLNPSVPTIALRTTRTAIPLSEGTYIPARARVLVSVVAAQRSSSLGAPDDFVPGRWASGAHEVSRCLLPFGHGPRGCIAQALASALVEETVALLCAGYELELLAPPRAVTSASAVRAPVGGRLWLRALAAPAPA